MSRHDVVSLACPGLAEVRAAYCSSASDADRVAALVEIAGAAAALARTICRYRHLDPVQLAELVSRPIDVPAALGRGTWLPTMVFSIPTKPERNPLRRKTSNNTPSGRGSTCAVQSTLFPVVPAFASAGGAR
ncbi:hypothetical protein Athai_54380 [Actinocatenispora thailandica]|uniref:Uncharacterized protein n=1 Tax=Actinocatenispora thailandica TaxID=227318 RepID=A0A7R7DU77_9ACTN|nr:hypothetical protein [Actinocatenispora thailandica]BCJ37935.1 hypothetical protein Athai_54380 [Actinocatenispora thailandica]